MSVAPVPTVLRGELNISVKNPKKEKKMNPKQFAVKLGWTTPHHIYKLYRDGRIPAAKIINGHLEIPADAVITPATGRRGKKMNPVDKTDR